MLLIHGKPATALRCSDHQVTEFKPKSIEPLDSEFDVKSQGTNFRIEAEQGSVQASKSGYSTPASASSVEEETISYQAVQYSTPLDHSASSDTLVAHDAYSLDTTTFPQHAVHLLPSEPNGTWRARASYAMVGSIESAPNLHYRYEDPGSEVQLRDLLDKSKEIAHDSKDDLESWLNQHFTETDMSGVHDRIRRGVCIVSMPNMRQFEMVVDRVFVVTEVAQSSQEFRSESELLEDFKNDKYMFAHILSRMAQRALVEQGVCKKWQLECARHIQLQHAMQTALLHTFVRIQQVHKDVPLFRAQPKWNAEREKKLWRLELDVGKVGIEVGPVTDRSLIELGPIDTGFELPESCSCVSIVELDRQIYDVEEGWHLLEA